MKSSITDSVISSKPSSMNMAVHDTSYRRKYHHLHRSQHLLLKGNSPKRRQANITVTHLKARQASNTRKAHLTYTDHH
ncbi:hypothetical protein OnM2_074033 [Erysiphe neolycopersici]|uniref:Uncharacterized protein n=1 Tax=Erysiphe neolycopersici TaxID=212602 RepID=A0A420HIY7_9PEZI|nr:hypothetical protein OnM2_074033 [Erysiphe neolycopersici]